LTPLFVENMVEAKHQGTIKKLSFAGILITLGIVFGDIGTSPLYVMKAILSSSGEINELLVYGSLSCVFWTLTLQTTIKYVIITLRADNRGEGGIFALFALIKKKSTLPVILTIVGGSALLADGVITPSITVTSSIEGLKLFNPEIPVILLVLIILSLLFFIQQFGTQFIGSSFGPIMIAWFSMLGILGISQIVEYPIIFKAANPVYALKFLTQYPGGFVLLGAIFLCTTGAEALYSDLGHCGVKNIRVAWIFVKSMLLLNYFGQGSWLMTHTEYQAGMNPFFGIMPTWFLLPGIIISTAAAIIASQALISGSYTLVSEAISLNFWPKIRVLHPTSIKGQVYIPFINWFLFFACCFVVIFFQESSNMEAAYGLSITITMIMTSCLLMFYLSQSKIHPGFLVLFFTVFMTIEGSFLIANLHKFSHGGWVSILIAFVIILIMYGWYFGRKIKNRHISYIDIRKYFDLFDDLSTDKSIPKIATNLVYIIKANNKNSVESKIIYSIFNKQPKRADRYWLLHVNILDYPDTFTYKVTRLVNGNVIRVDFNLGFKIEPRINLYFREVLEDLVASGEIDLISSYESLKKHQIPADFLFVNLDRIMTRDHKLTPWEALTMNLHTISRFFSINDIKALGLDTSNVIEEKIPISIERPITRRIQRKE
jgi:KUP system potassium uptake protein